VCVCVLNHMSKWLVVNELSLNINKKNVIKVSHTTLMMNYFVLSV
jgi:hypothetical protein